MDAPRDVAPRSERNIRLAEEIVPVGSLPSRSLYINQGSTDVENRKVFLMHGLNTVTLPAFIASSSPHIDHTIDVYALLKCVYAHDRPVMLEQIVSEYAATLHNDDVNVHVTEELRDELFGILIHSQAAMPLASLCGHIGSWNSRSLVPRFQNIDQVISDVPQDVAAVYNVICANADMSIFDVYDSMFAGNESREESDRIQSVIAGSVEVLLRAGAVWVNVPTKLYNQ